MVTFRRFSSVANFGTNYFPLKIKILAKRERELTTKFAIARNGCYRKPLLLALTLSSNCGQQYPFCGLIFLCVESKILFRLRTFKLFTNSLLINSSIIIIFNDFFYFVKQTNTPKYNH